MNIVLEGPDGAGKSTLAKTLAIRTGMPIVQGKGPPKSNAEFDQRVSDYLQLQGVILDRHPCISEKIYAEALEREAYLQSHQVKMFLNTRPFIVYVRPSTRELPDSHEVKDYESAEHVQAVELHHKRICELYDAHMMHTAHYIYRRDDAHLSSLLRCASVFLTKPTLFPMLFPTSGDLAFNGAETGRRWSA